MVSIIDNEKPFTIDRSRLDQVPTPNPTLSWTPLPHHELMNRVERKIGDYGYRITHSHCLLSHGGDRLFGSITLGSRRSLGYRRMIGVRNSHDKSVAAGLISGARVTVCANGMFTGDDICLNRKHTSRLYEDLDQKIDEGFQKVFSEWERNDLRIMRFRETEISDERAHDLIIRSVDGEAIAPSAIPKVLREWREPWHQEFVPRTAWSLHNAFTEVLKEKAHLIPERSRILTSVFDRELGIA